MPTVAVIDDSKLVLSAVRLGLEPLGWVVHTFENDFGVSLQVKSVEPDIVLIDMNMPLLNGPALLRSLRRSSSARMLFHSDQPVADLRKAADANKADGFIKKTGDAKQLDIQLRRHLRAA